jgi:hypothetical protein
MYSGLVSRKKEGEEQLEEETGREESSDAIDGFSLRI